MVVFKQMLLRARRLTGRRGNGKCCQQCNGSRVFHGITPDLAGPPRRALTAERLNVGLPHPCGSVRGWTGGTPLSAKDNAWLNVIFRQFSPFFVNESLVESHYTGGDACDLTPADN